MNKINVIDFTQSVLNALRSEALIEGWDQQDEKVRMTMADYKAAAASAEWGQVGVKIEDVSLYLISDESGDLEAWLPAWETHKFGLEYLALMIAVV